MNVRIVKPRFLDDDKLTMAASFVLDQLNLIEGRGDFEVYDASRQEFTLRNNTACTTFCTKQEKCDVDFCHQYHQIIQAGVSFIDDKITVSNLKCANLEDPYCEVRVTFCS